MESGEIYQDQWGRWHVNVLIDHAASEKDAIKAAYKTLGKELIRGSSTTRRDDDR